MIIFIDESGVHRPTGHSVFALVLIKSIDIQFVEEKVISVEKKLDIESFHWADSAWPVKIKFFNQILSLPFTFIIEIFNNPVKQDKALEEVIIKNCDPGVSNSIYIDGAKPRWYISRIKKTLRDCGIPIHSVKMTSDERSTGLRLADLVAGLIRAYVDGSRKSDLLKMYKKLLKKQNPQSGVR